MRVGFDPEVFFRTDEKHISVIGKLGGTKDAAKKINDIVYVLEDNVAAEFNSPPCPDVDSFIKAIEENLAFLSETAASMGCRLSTDAYAEFPIEELCHPMAFVFGCEPDYNAWTGKINPSPSLSNPFARSAGGHVHVEYEGDKENLIRALDLFIGVPSTVLDSDVRRRALYGKAGAYRPKSYGAEYRTLSNFWIFKKDLIRLVWDRVSKAVEFSRSNVLLGDSKVGHAVLASINDNNADATKFLFKEFPEIAV